MKNIYIKGDSSEDVSMRWRNTILGIDVGEPKILPFMVSRHITVKSNENRYLMEGHIEDKGVWKPYLLDTSLPKKIIPFPITGYFNINKYTVGYVSRYASTTTRKGLLAECVSQPLNSMLNAQDINIGLPTKYKAAYNPVYYDVNTIIEAILSKKAIGLALSPNLLLGLHTQSPNLVVYRNRKIIAEYDVTNNNTYINKEINVFSKELSEYGFNNLIEVSKK
jgi:hypothetical protein